VQRGHDFADTRQGAISRPQKACALTNSDVLDSLMFEEPARDFHARITRNSRSHGLTMRARRKLVYRRMGVLVIAMAVPAMAAPGLQQPQGQAALQPSLIQPLAPATDDWSLIAPIAEPVFQPDPAAPELGQDLALDAGPAARPFMAALGYSDRARAQQCLAMAVYYEAASESIDGQRAVAQVVMNRVRHPAYPASVCGVVFQGSERTTGCQFSFTCDGSMNRQPQASAMAQARMVARAALDGYVYAPVGMATHYHTTNIYPYWASSLQTVGTIGLHRFYRWSGAAGRPGAFTASYVGGEAIPLYRPQRVDAVAAAPSLGADRPYRADLSIALDNLPAAPAPLAVPTASAASTIRPQSGAVLEQHARSDEWLNDPR
jgi:spore germination cell wall hydrolase CwlJ-like protein